LNNISWIKTNLNERISDPSLDFKVELQRQSFERLPFNDAAINLANHIKNNYNKKIYVCLSGGMDSEFLVRLFHKLKIDFTALIAKPETFSAEREYAYELINELKIPFKILTFTDKQWLQTYYKWIHKKYNSHNLSAIFFYLAEYVESEGGMIVDGTHFGGFNGITFHAKNIENFIIQNDGNIPNIVGNQIFYVREMEMLYAESFSNLPYITFFQYNPQIVVAMLDAIQKEDLTWNHYKSRLYQVSYRPKIMTSFIRSNFQNLLLNMGKFRKYTPVDTVVFGKKEELIEKIWKP
jgi:hypothetical protein